jgi:hypothetical protein
LGDEEFDFLLNWEHVSVDTSSDEELEDLFCELERIVPHIKWRISVAEYDGAEITTYKYLEVPDYQYEEAEEIIERMENGEDLENYSPLDKFPGLFIDMNGEKIINPTVTRFQKLISEFGDFIDKPEAENLASALKKFVGILSNIYASAFELPDFRMEVDADSSSYHGFIFEDYIGYKTDFQRQEEITDNCIEHIYQISDNLNEIYSDLKADHGSWYIYVPPPNGYYQEYTTEGLAQAVCHWRDSFFWEYEQSLGSLIIETLDLIRKIIGDLK